MKHRLAQYQDIESVLLLRHKRGTVMPRYTPLNWWECDVCEITETGYFREFEIKMTLKDFRIDAQKTKAIYVPDCRIGQKPESESKHDLLARGSPRGPVEFWYVSPKGVIDPALIPSWAGFIGVEMGAYRPVEVILKRAPRLHKEKAAPSVKAHMENVSYWRFHHVLQNQYHRWKTKFSPPTN